MEHIYNITIGNKKVFDNLTLQEAKGKCCLLLALSSRLDIFYQINEVE